MLSEYKVENDEYYKNFVAQSSRTERTTENYRKVLKKFCIATGKTLTEIVTTCIDEQSIVTTVKLDPDENGNERRKEIKFNINDKDAAINIFLQQFEDHCFKKNNKEITIQNQTDIVRSFLHENGVELPKRKSYKDDSRDWYLPSKMDFNYFLQDVSLTHASLANMLTSSGMRVSDALSFTIGDFMNATSDYHDFVDVEDFIDNAPDDMIGTWVFEPQKTRKHHVKCITFNSAHASNMILQNLRHIKNHYMPYKNRAEGLKLTNKKKDPLFASRKGKYKKPLSGRSVAAYWIEKNKKFQVWKKNQIKQQIENSEISEEDYDEAVSKIPKLHPHICRKFFSTIVSNNCGDIRVCGLLEGHSAGLPNDKSYIKKSVEDIREIYINNIHDELSLDHVETKIISDKETERLNAEIESLKAENAKIREEKDQEISNIEQKHQEEINEIKSSMGNMQRQMDNLNRMGFSRKTKNDMEQAINGYCKSNLDEEDMQKNYIIRSFALDMALENKKDFENTDEYLSSLIKKARIKISMSGKTTGELFNQIMEQNDKDYVMNKQMTNAVREVMKTMTSNTELMEIISDEDYYELQDAIETYLKRSNYDITNLTDSDKTEIVSAVLMEFV